MARLVAITGPMDEAKKADLIEALDPILKEQVAAHRICSQLLADDLANALALLDIQQREHKEEETKINEAICRTVGEMVAVQKKLDAAEARIIELEDEVDECNDRMERLVDKYGGQVHQLAIVQTQLDIANAKLGGADN